MISMVTITSIYVWTYLFTLGSGADSEGCRPVHLVKKSDEEQCTAVTVQNRRGRHAQNPQPHIMRSAANDKQSRDDEDSKGGRVRQHIEAPPMIRSQGSIEPVHLDQSERTESEFEIRGATPDGCHNSKDNPAFDIASVLHAVV